MGSLQERGLPERGGSPSTQRVRADRTRRALVAAATALFGARGFHATGATELVCAASVTRGALYHHFGSKEALFVVVFETALCELHGAARGSVRHLSGDTWAQLTGSLHVYLDLLATRPDLRRILLLDGPVLLGWDRWHEIQGKWLHRGVVETFDLLRTEGALEIGPAEPLALLIQGALNEAAMAIAHSDDPVAATEGLSGALAGLLEGIRLRSGGRARADRPAGTPRTGG